MTTPLAHPRTLHPAPAWLHITCALRGHQLDDPVPEPDGRCVHRRTCACCGRSFRTVQHARPEVVASDADPDVRVLRCRRCGFPFTQWLVRWR